MQEINDYAPVIIPTLNRYEHFKRCLESLEKCTGAKYTDVYVGLDFPPSDKYFDGWKKIDSYLRGKELSNGFRNLYIRRREHNCGVGGKNGNLRLLREEIQDKYYAYILTEDDNEFSPCFLDFMNKALLFYKEDLRVSAICGFNQYYTERHNIVFTYDNSAWGVGRWVERGFPPKDETMASMKKAFNVMKVFWFFPSLLSKAMDMINQKKTFGDAVWTCWNIINEKYQLRPSVSLVKNWGCDGSGQHCTVLNSYSQMQISKDAVFDFSFGKPKRTREIDSMVRHNMMPASFFDFIKQEISIGLKAIKFLYNQYK